MSENTKIAWTDASWNPVVGCTKVSDGCKNCYAERMGRRQAGMECANLKRKRKYTNVMKLWHDPKIEKTYWKGWNGKTCCDESALEIPLHWKKPRMVFVPSMGDLFHKSVPFDFIDKVMIVIANCKQHTFQILTKRPERMLQYFKDFPKEIGAKNKTFDKNFLKENLIKKLQNHRLVYRNFSEWPPENLWLGVTAENQEQVDKRIPILLQIPAAVRFVSVEPMLGPVDIIPYCGGRAYKCQCAAKPWHHTESNRLSLMGDTALCLECQTHAEIYPTLDQVIIGCESGPGARECKTEWVRDLVGQCQSAGVAVFVKQLRLWKYHQTLNEKAHPDLFIGSEQKSVKTDKIGYFPEDLQIREYPK